MKEGLPETFARLRQEEGRTSLGIALVLIEEIFFGQGSTPPPEKTTTKLLVFAAGLPRSGTGSLAVALADLGHRPLHGPGIMELATVLSEHCEGRATPLDGHRCGRKERLDERHTFCCLCGSTPPDVLLSRTAPSAKCACL